MNEIISFIGGSFGIQGRIASQIADAIRREVVAGTRDIFAMLPSLVDSLGYKAINLIRNKQNAMATEAVNRFTCLHRGQNIDIREAELIARIENALQEREIFPLTFNQETLITNSIVNGLQRLEQRQAQQGWFFRAAPQLDINNLSNILDDVLPKIRRKLRVQIQLIGVIEYKELRHTTPLVYAAQENSVEDVRALLAIGQTDEINDVIREGDGEGFPLLVHAVWRNKVELARELMRYLSVDYCSNLVIPAAGGGWAEWTVLAYSIRDNCVGLVREFLNHGVSPNQDIKLGGWRDWSFLAFAVRTTNSDMVRALLSHWPDDVLVDQIMPPGDEWSGWSLLAFAVRLNQVEIARELLNKGANPTRSIEQGGWSDWSLLAYAVRNNYVNMTHELLSHWPNDVSVDHIMPDGDWAGWSTFSFVVRENNVETARELFNHGFNPNQNINAGGYQGWPFLAYAVWKGNIEMANLLLAKGANPDVRFPVLSSVSAGPYAGRTVREYIAENRTNITLPAHSTHSNSATYSPRTRV